MKKKVTFKQWIKAYVKAPTEFGDLAREVTQETGNIEMLNDLVQRAKTKKELQTVLRAWTFYLLEQAETLDEATEALASAQGVYECLNELSKIT
ncbi:hypothetical protein NHG32_02465 [Aerococcaceae bacterium NML191219]|nr:hypothetical protein [Aerococcaceae bacterium NML191219]